MSANSSNLTVCKTFNNHHMSKEVGIVYSNLICKKEINFAFTPLLQLRNYDLCPRLSDINAQNYSPGFMVQVENPVICKMLTQVSQHRKLDLSV